MRTASPRSDPGPSARRPPLAAGVQPRPARPADTVVLGVDPGTAVTGYGVVARSGDGAVSLLECGVIRTHPRAPLPERLRDIYEGIREVIERARPGAVAVEAVFYAKNVRTS
ncbi:MAG TPA: crossover junction endodeoxyribonuclease RuvC, partial [Longimicrobiaceae bacterium]|nr:crossover junction endodeoxyribonuclease RuvC [Longimicrobiaceae bacterium]